MIWCVDAGQTSQLSVQGLGSSRHVFSWNSCRLFAPFLQKDTKERYHDRRAETTVLHHPVSDIDYFATARQSSMEEIPHGYCKKEGWPLYLLGIESLFSVSIQAEAMLAGRQNLRMG
jgi:hypothetical protein